MTSLQSTPAQRGGAAPAGGQDSEPPDEFADLTPSELSIEPEWLSPAPPATSVGGSIVEELTSRLPTSDLVKIIKGALECGRHNQPFTESDLLRAMTFGANSVPFRPAPRDPRLPRR